MRVKRNNRAFTLIELLVVVAIIMVLISILLPSLGRARAQAKTVSCQVNERSLYMATTYYAGDNQNIIVRASENTSDMGVAEWIKMLNGRGYLSADKSTQSDAYVKVRYCPAVDPNTTTLSSYILSFATSGTYRDVSGRPVYIRFQDFAAPASTFFFGDYVAPPPDNSTHTVSWDTQLIRLGQRHGEQYRYFNVTWLDGHISLEKHPLPDRVWAMWMWASNVSNPY